MQAPAVPSSGVVKGGSRHKHLRHVACAASAFFGQQQKNIKAPFKGLAGSLLRVYQGWCKGGGTQSYQQFTQSKKIYMYMS